MSAREQIRSRKLWIWISFITMIVVNALADWLPINGKTTREVSEAYPNLFSPAPFTFAIWGLIYLLLAGYVLYWQGFFRKGNNKVTDRLLYNTGLYFIVSSFANAAWMICWHFELLFATMLLMVTILVCLILISNLIAHEVLSLRNKLFIQLPMRIYFGWITAATIANASTLLVSIGWDGFGISDVTWTVIVLILGTIIGLFASIPLRDSAYLLALTWAYFGIYMKHTQLLGGKYPAIITTVIACMLCLVAVSIYNLFSKPRKGKK